MDPARDGARAKQPVGAPHDGTFAAPPVVEHCNHPGGHSVLDRPRERVRKKETDRASWM